MDTLFTKSDQWKHEREYRQVFQLADLVCHSPGRGKAASYFLNISSDAIRDIIFGCRVPVRLKNAIRKEIQRQPKKFGHIRLCQCIRHDTKFELDMKELGGAVTRK